jgi:hypothetical protein
LFARYEGKQKKQKSQLFIAIKEGNGPMHQLVDALQNEDMGYVTRNLVDLP